MCGYRLNHIVSATKAREGEEGEGRCRLSVNFSMVGVVGVVLCGRPKVLFRVRSLYGGKKFQVLQLDIDS